LITRGIIIPTENLKEPKDIEAYNLVNKGSFMNEGQPIDPKIKDSVYFDEDLVDENMHRVIVDGATLEVVTFDDPGKVKYKNHLISLFRDIEDPFQQEFEGVMNYEQNPSNPSQP